MNVWGLLFLTIFALSQQVFAEVEEGGFRTPARLQGSVYTAKLVITRNFTDYVVPVWVRPDQEKSVLDLSMMSKLGWHFSDTRYDRMTLSGHELPRIEFQKGKANFVGDPEFPKECCYGTLGADLLQHFRLRFDPKTPSHIYWNLILGKGKAMPELKSLLSYRSNWGKFPDLSQQKIDLGVSAYEVYLAKKRVKPSPDQKEAVFLKRVISAPVVDFEFLVPLRKVRVNKINPEFKASADAVGLKVGAVFNSLQSIAMFFYDAPELDRYFRGAVDPVIMFSMSPSLKSSESVNLQFDFEKKEWRKN